MSERESESEKENESELNVLVGHATNAGGTSGVTVFVPPPGAAHWVASASFVGPAPGTRDCVLLAPDKSVARLDALVFAGGSAFGLAAASGVACALRDRGVGLDTPGKSYTSILTSCNLRCQLIAYVRLCRQPCAGGRVPIVSSAVIFDLVRAGNHGGLAAPDAPLGAQALQK